MSGQGEALGHASAVAQHFYSSHGSIAPGIATVFMCCAESSFNAVANTEPPPSLPASGGSAKVQNHSWVGFTGTAQTVLRKFDFILNRDSVLACVGLLNSLEMTDVWGNSYHALAVGVMSGSHTRNDTTVDVVDRMKPDLVVAEDLTCFATQAVASACALLVDAAARLNTTAAARAQVVRTLLLAAASKPHLPGWQHASPPRPTTRSSARES